MKYVSLPVPATDRCFRSESSSFRSVDDDSSSCQFEKEFFAAFLKQSSRHDRSGVGALRRHRATPTSNGNQRMNVVSRRAYRMPVRCRGSEFAEASTGGAVNFQVTVLKVLVSYPDGFMEARPAAAQQATELPDVRAVEEPTPATTLSPMPSIAPVRRMRKRSRGQRDAIRLRQATASERTSFTSEFRCSETGINSIIYVMRTKIRQFFQRAGHTRFHN